MAETSNFTKYTHLREVFEITSLIRVIRCFIPARMSQSALAWTALAAAA
jgi:hypothetical protein